LTDSDRRSVFSITAQPTVKLVLLLLLLVMFPPQVSAMRNPPIVHTTRSSRLFYALLGPIVFVVTDSRSNDASNIGLWSAEELVGTFVSLVSGSFALTTSRSVIVYWNSRLEVTSCGAY